MEWVLFKSDHKEIVYYYTLMIYYEWKTIMMANTVPYFLVISRS